MTQKAVADETVGDSEKTNTKKKKQRILLCEGPAKGNGAASFLLREDLIIHKNKELIVGEDISEHEAELLLHETTWNFKEVTK
ncbi:hypothetical protein [Bacillus cereus group sp. BfR-BA-01328]|uniref:hypothetical protein n=1 Tax=Bacillus cereus group sp. BfR-BA-01328 TaxID=2920304 RepID=UPI001F59D707